MLGVVFAVNLLPAFGPPTWAVLVFFLLRHDLPEVVLVVGGAVAATAGRTILALACRRLGDRLPAGKRADLAAIGTAITARRRGQAGMMVFFVFSPLPSAQLFEAAGLTPDVRLGPLAVAFLLGRMVSYAIYVGGASAASTQLSSLLDDGLTSPRAIALQLLMLALLAAYLLIPWSKLGRRS
jgi:uncharacterized membrane protein YdjX (TVP38/TMEM64 family)